MSPPPTIPDDGILEIHLLQDLDSFFITLMQGVDNVSAEAVEYLERAKELKLLSYTCDENDDMFHTKTQAIPGVIGQLTKLEILNFAHNWISRLPEEIMSLQNLKWLNLSYNQLRTITPQLAEWLATIDTVPLTGNKITVAAPADNYFYF
ncbi:hypothetical protein HOD08_04390 [bacterium]|nr:hypothetical protein [bacterium]